MPAASWWVPPRGHWVRVNPDVRGEVQSREGGIGRPGTSVAPGRPAAQETDDAEAVALWDSARDVEGLSAEEAGPILGVALAAQKTRLGSG